MGKATDEMKKKDAATLKRIKRLKEELEIIDTATKIVDCIVKADREISKEEMIEFQNLLKRKVKQNVN